MLPFLLKTSYKLSSGDKKLTDNNNLTLPNSNEPSGTSGSPEHRSVKTEIVSVLSALLLSGILFGTSAGIFIKIIITMFVSGVYAVLLISRTSFFVKLVPVLFPICSAIIHALAISDMTSSDKSAFCAGLVLFVCFLLASAVITFCIIKRFTKTETLISLSAATLLSGAIGVVSAFIYNFGAFSISLLQQKISEYCAKLHDVVMKYYTLISQSEEFSQMLSKVSGGESMSQDEFLSLADEYTELVITSLKAITPAVLIILAMTAAAIALLGFTVCTGITRKKNLLGKGYFEYSVSSFSARVFNTVLFISMLGTFIGLPGLVLTVCVNLLLILIPPMSYIGIRCIFRIMLLRNMHPVGAAAVIFAILTVLVFITGGFAVIAAALSGVFFTFGAEARAKMFGNHEK